MVDTLRTARIHAHSDAILDLLDKRKADPLEGLAALAYTLGFSFGVTERSMGVTLKWAELVSVAGDARKLGQFLPQDDEGKAN